MEKRDKYFKSVVLKFEDLGQYKRKLKKGNLIKTSLQCDEDDTAVAWQNDWLKERLAILNLYS